MGGGHSSGGTSLLRSPLHWLRMKATFLFPPNSVSVFFFFISWRLITLHVSVFFIQLQGAEKAKSFGSKTLNPSHWPSKAIAIMGLSDSPLLSQPAV